MAIFKARALSRKQHLIMLCIWLLPLLIASALLYVDPHLDTFHTTFLSLVVLAVIPLILQSIAFVLDTRNRNALTKQDPGISKGSGVVDASHQRLPTP